MERLKDKIVVLKGKDSGTDAMFSMYQGDAEIIEVYEEEEVYNLIVEYGGRIKMILADAGRMGQETDTFLEGLKKSGYRADYPVIGVEVEDSNLIRVLKNEADTDPLTKLYNRRAFKRLVQKTLEKKPVRAAFGIFDIDDFKVLNDKFGHKFGDEILFQLSKQLRECLGEDVLAGRFGGDEFVLFWEDLGCLEASCEMEEEAEHICQVMRQEFMGIRITGSLGIACYPRDGETYDELFRRADKALYLAKDRGKDRFVINGEELV